MARKRPSRTGGTVVVLEHRSKILADNPLGDSADRTLGVWLPHEYDGGATHGRGQRFPVLYDLVGFTGTGIAHLNWKPFSEKVSFRKLLRLESTRLAAIPTANEAMMNRANSRGRLRMREGRVGGFK